MRLGIDTQSGIVYEGVSDPIVPSFPMPAITQATLIHEETDWQSIPASFDPNRWIFREDSFDPVTRTRRGRIYQPYSSTQPTSEWVHQTSFEGYNGRPSDRRIRRDLFTFRSCSALLDVENRAEGMTIALGQARAASSWRILQTELLVSGAVMITLKSLSSFGILPPLQADALPGAHRTDVQAAIGTVLDSAFRESPAAIVDKCRNAAQVLISSWLSQANNDESKLGQELAKLAEMAEKEPHRKIVAGNLGKILARLHARTKPNHVRSDGHRPVHEEDAETAVHCLGMLIRELGWAAA